MRCTQNHPFTFSLFLIYLYRLLPARTVKRCYFTSYCLLGYLLRNLIIISFLSYRRNKSCRVPFSSKGFNHYFSSSNTLRLAGAVVDSKYSPTTDLYIFTTTIHKISTNSLAICMHNKAIFSYNVVNSVLSSTNPAKLHYLTTSLNNLV